MLPEAAQIEKLKADWNILLTRLNTQFGGSLDLDGVLFLIGVQVLGMGYKKFSKDQKLNVLHIAICKLLEPYGYYEYEGLDKDGWPHWRLKEELPPLKAGEQQYLIKEAIVNFFKEEETIEP
ncbi:MAG: hypothetical protein J0M08_00995 [Bacteroidetes bacterium]|nr:hypothetical protein [Bacteroidota bacterium]